MTALYSKIIVSVLVCLGLGIASGFSTADSISGWYQTIQKPSWNPPNWIFGPVWSILYIMMGVAVALVWHSDHELKKLAVGLFVVQFVLNLLWSYLFFGRHNITLALVEILAMWVMIVTTTIVFYRINHTAAYLMIPYLLWVSFACFLNYSIRALNH